MKVAIAGYGTEGEASYSYWNTPDNDVTIVDEREQLDNAPNDAKTMLGADTFSQLGDFDLIIRSPGINPKKLPYGDKIWSATNEFFDKCPTSIIGVTGTKGKGTTCSLIASILRAAGKTVHLVGNIGVPALAELSKIKPDDIVVFELSSFQLWDVKQSPHVAVVLMIEPDHLDVHPDFGDYIEAKANIARFQTSIDSVVFNKANEWSRAIANRSVAKQVEYPFELGELAAAVSLPGQHNLDNTCAAVAATTEYVSDREVIRTGLAAFKGLPHRLKFVREVNDVKYYDDSIATTPGSAVAALHSFDESKVLILGGKDKGGGYDEVIAEAKATNTTIIAIGETRKKIAELCRDADVDCYENDSVMLSIVAQAAKIATPGSIVILSPASASYDQYKNYADRGDQFIAAVNSL